VGLPHDLTDAIGLSLVKEMLPRSRPSNRVLRLAFRLDARWPWLSMPTLSYLIPAMSPPTRGRKAIQVQSRLAVRMGWTDLKGGRPAHSFRGLLTLDIGLVTPWTWLRLPEHH
jgi:hypothetical protein